MTALRGALGITAEAAGMPSALVKTLPRGLTQRDVGAVPVRPAHAPQPDDHRRPDGSPPRTGRSSGCAAIGKATGTTLNDVVLAMCCGALRTYLLELDALPDAPLVAMVPVGLNAKQSARRLRRGRQRGRLR